MAYGLEKIVSKDAPVYQQVINYYDYCKRCRMSERTMKNKICRINGFIKYSGISSLEQITNQQIDEWIDYMIGKHNSGRTINGFICQLRVMLRWQRDDNVSMPNLKISRIIMQKELPPRKIAFTHEQIDRVLEKANQKEWLLIKLAFDCGLRISELRNLRLDDINGRVIRIVGKGQRLRYVKMSKEARKRLDNWILENNVVDYLWVSRQNKTRPMCDMCTRRAMGRPFVAVGIYNFHPHALRHSYATELKKLGVPTRKIQAGMGHTTEAITEKYLSDLDGFNIDEIYDIKYGEGKRKIITKLIEFVKIFRPANIWHKIS